MIALKEDEAPMFTFNKTILRGSTLRSDKAISIRYWIIKAPERKNAPGLVKF